MRRNWYGCPICRRVSWESSSPFGISSRPAPPPSSCAISRFIWIFIIRAEVSLAPCHHCLQDRYKTLPKFRQGILDLRRNFLINLSVEKSVALQFPELPRQSGLGNSVKTAHQFAESLNLVK